MGWTATAAVLRDAAPAAGAANDNAPPGGHETWNLNYHRYYDPAVGRYTQPEPPEVLLDHMDLVSQAAPDGVSLDPEHYASWNAFAYVMNSPLAFVDLDGLSGSRPGGPYHPPRGVRPGCRPGDTCQEIEGKMWVLRRMLRSHTGWDRAAGRGRHSQEIADLWNAYANCQWLQSQYCRKNKDECNPCRYGPLALVGVAVAGALCVIIPPLRLRLPQLIFAP